MSDAAERAAQVLYEARNAVFAWTDLADDGPMKTYEREGVVALMAHPDLLLALAAEAHHGHPVAIVDGQVRRLRTTETTGGVVYTLGDEVGES